ncbi:Z1 domain-containing protein [Nocardia mexicana]|uniref:Z1 domain-containing protein n=1 Tax=Nocardia mexicana TaxID=279262 RepID=A0A370H0A2_9NOCA|nr:Z1 domain-containing protein [Nocardia mexicana]RDI49172.1 Z1 domain-containing protein [Nocardia mexicana]
MVEPVDDAYETFEMLLDRNTPEEAVKRLVRLGTSAEIVQKVRERHEQRLLAIREMEEPHSVVLGNRFTWYTGPQPGDKFWPALLRILGRQGWNDASVTSLEKSSTRIVSLLNHPLESQFSARGLVVGHVQSGKTTNFTAVTAKAADRGYKLFIVLAGIHNGLRRQTQARLVEQLVRPNPASWTLITKLEHDFVPPENPASFFGGANRTHLLCVVKKNAAVLRKLVQWLQDAQDYLGDTPALIIDDEADQATVATETINPLIMGMINSLPKAAYVGYTASPFANLLINPAEENDLYPRDFIVNLPKPPGHFGTEVLFGRYALDGEDPNDVFDGHDMIRTVPDEDVPLVRPRTKAEAEDFTPVLTASLQRALKYFWLATAARRVRGTGNPHSTMLIHTSVRTSVHNSFRPPLENLREQVARNLDDPTLRAELRVLWAAETARVPVTGFEEPEVRFDEVFEELPGVLQDCRVIMDNSGSTDRLDYENGPVVAIAVGGNTLSRGLTLEGLLVSYFVRAVTVYDTLLQMGRWFGYRYGYQDLPRIWMTRELEDWFRHLATVEAEMRRDIDIYMTEDKTPMTFAVRLRTHPALRVTAAAKMQDAVITSAGYGGQRVQTRYFYKDREWLLGNQEAARKLISAAVRSRRSVEGSAESGRFIFRGVPSDYILEFLEIYQFHKNSQECNAAMMSHYIKARIRNAAALGRWNVVIMGNSLVDDSRGFEFAEEVTVGRVIRSAITSDSNFADIKTLMSRKDAAIDLTGAIQQWSEKQIRNERAMQMPDSGLLVLYPIDKESEPSNAQSRRHALDAPEHVIGVGFMFPKPINEESTVPWELDYISANLSEVPGGAELEDDDLSLLNAEELV